MVCVVLTCCLAAQAQETVVTGHVDLVAPGGQAWRGGQANTAVWLTPVAQSPAALVKEDPKPAPRLVQKNKSFEPRVVILRAGTAVEFPNHDPFFHNVFSLFDGKRFDLGLYEAGGTRIVHFDRAGISYIFCNIHPEMSAVVIAVATPYYALSDGAGNVAIRSVPAGLERTRPARNRRRRHPRTHPYRRYCLLRHSEPPRLRGPRTPAQKQIRP